MLTLTIGMPVDVSSNMSVWAHVHGRVDIRPSKNEDAKLSVGRSRKSSKSREMEKKSDR